KPTRIVNTHAHFDHISGNGAFDMIFAHPMEIASIAKAGYRANPVSDGNGFDLGGRVIQVISLPGHSPGSIALWDAAAGLLFAGDTIASGRPVSLSLEGASLEAYIRSLSRLLSLERTEDGGRIDRIFCSHGDLECGMDTVRALHALAEGVADDSVDREAPPPQIASYKAENVSLVRGNEGVSLLIT
ncbi:MBL fold metallo-hydrolase, partial [Eubacteriales bacterium OttesenSCG-928-A19]|nr:MBL fold metallo-hydrolase [Eubacteriales bacterium OttesenSCG-928-A19]